MLGPRPSLSHAISDSYFSFSSVTKVAKDSFAALRAAFLSRFAMLSASILSFGPVPLRVPPLPPALVAAATNHCSSKQQQQ